MGKHLNQKKRLRIVIRGAVQGVGFRPFVYRLATELGLTGWVKNSGSGVIIEAEGDQTRLESLLSRIRQERPASALIHGESFSYLDYVGHSPFKIDVSDHSEQRTTIILPDIATCPDCLKELFDPKDRRHLYPFINCTHCGPRYSIIELLPYDRKNTSMKYFVMCENCRKEYEDPLNRRFHAQPNACAECGPQLELWNHNGRCIAACNEAMIKAADGIREGRIVAFKGLGGFQLMVSAGNDDAVARLRMRKQREEKPLALMFPSLETTEKCCRVSIPERFVLESSAAPIVLLERKAAFSDKIHIAASVAPGNPCYGVMLPYTPMHHMLMKEFGAPLVATSGNLTDEPICIDEKEALHRLRGVADLFLIHNRPVIRYVDDSVVRVIMDRPMMLRRARGYAPLPVESPEVLPPILGVGGHLKNTVAVSVEKNIIVSQHIGDLETKLSFDAFRRAVDTFGTLYESSPTLVACDMHPGYSSTRFARQTAIPSISVQHHHAHIAACMAENDIWSNVLGVAWDGTGFGTDGSIWGGEFLLSTISGFDRIGHFRTFRLPGGDKAVKEPRRTALGVLYEVFGDEAFNLSDLPCLKAFNYRELNIICQMLTRGVNAPVTSSAGRLFDAVASLIGLHQTISFEGQAAMALETVIDGTALNIQYPYEILRKKVGQTVLLVIDWSPMIKEIVRDIRRRFPAGHIAKKFHNTLIEIVVAMSKRTREKSVVLSGGCFQNKFLTEGVVKRLREEGFHPFWHQRIPPNDGGIAIGQVVLTSRCLKASGDGIKEKRDETTRHYNQGDYCDVSSRTGENYQRQ